MKREDMTEEQRLILKQYTYARNMVDRLSPYLKTLIPPKFEIGQLVTIVGSHHHEKLRIYNRFLTEGGVWFYQMQVDTGTYVHKYAASQYEDHLVAVPEERRV